MSFVGLLSRDQIIDLIHKVMAKNEGADDHKYQLEKIKIGKSGYTFGQCQHDCGQRKDATNFIHQLLIDAKVDIDTVNDITLKLQDHTKSLSAEEVKIVNGIFSQPEVRVAIDQYDSKHINKLINEVLLAINDVSRWDASKSSVQNQIMSDPVIFIQLVDYHNQFNLASTGPLISFLSGHGVDRSEIGAGVAHLDLTRVTDVDLTKPNTGLLNEIRGYINNYTTYSKLSAHNLQDCLRRQSNIDSLSIPQNACGLPENHRLIAVGGCPGGITGNGPLIPPPMHTRPQNPTPAPGPRPAPTPPHTGEERPPFGRRTPDPAPAPKPPIDRPPPTAPIPTPRESKKPAPPAEPIIIKPPVLGSFSSNNVNSNSFFSEGGLGSDTGSASSSYNAGYKR